MSVKAAPGLASMKPAIFVGRNLDVLQPRPPSRRPLHELECLNIAKCCFAELCPYIDDSWLIDDLGNRPG